MIRAGQRIVGKTVKSAISVMVMSVMLCIQVHAAPAAQTVPTPAQTAVNENAVLSASQGYAWVYSTAGMYDAYVFNGAGQYMDLFDFTTVNRKGSYSGVYKVVDGSKLGPQSGYSESIGTPDKNATYLILYEAAFNSGAYANPAVNKTVAYKITAFSAAGFTVQSIGTDGSVMSMTYNKLKIG